MTRIARPALKDKSTLIVCPASARSTYLSDPDAGKFPVMVAVVEPAANVIRSATSAIGDVEVGLTPVGASDVSVSVG